MPYTLRNWAAGPPPVSYVDMLQLNFGINDLDSRVGVLESRPVAFTPFKATVKTTGNSGAWTNGTKVMSNIVQSFTADAGATYSAEVTASILGPNAVITTAAQLFVQSGGSVTVGSGTPLISRTVRVTETGNIILPIGGLFDEFSTPSAGTWTVGVAGYHPTGDTGSTVFFANSTYNQNKLTIKRVA